MERGAPGYQTPLLAVTSSGRMIALPETPLVEIHKMDRLGDGDLIAVMLVRDAEGHTRVEVIRADVGDQSPNELAEIFGAMRLRSSAIPAARHGPGRR